MIPGSCLCGVIAFEIDPAAVAVSLGCHCPNCRKVSGAAGGVYLQVRPDGFRWLKGDDLVMTYESSPGNNRGFCAVCGSLAPVETAYGALDADPGIAPEVLLYAPRQPRWCDVAAAEPFEEAGPPEFWRKVVGKLTG